MGRDTMPVNILVLMILVSVEGGGQHTVVIKIEPGLEEESTSDIQKEQESATNDTQKDQSQVYF